MSYQTPRGTYDILPKEMKQWHYVEEVIRQTTKKYRYKEIRTPYFEETRVFKRENDSSDMVNKEMYTFATGDESYTLRPEGTAGVIRAFDQHKLYGFMELPARLYYLGAMFRHERPQKGRQRQFTQFGVENIGAKSPELDAETIALGYDIVKQMGISSIKVLINTLGDDESRANYRLALKEHFKPHLENLCTDCHRRYEQNPLRILDCKVDHNQECLHNAPRLMEYLNEESRDYFNRVLAALAALGIPYEVDDRLVRGLDYYTHTVFEVVSTREDSGAQATIFAGGRYDHFVEYYGGPDMSGIGFAIGMERLISLASDEGHDFGEDNTCDAYVIGLGDVSLEVLKLAQELRQNGFHTEANLLPRSLKSQFKSADRNHAKYVIILGEDEVKNHKVNVKRTSDKTQVTIERQELVKKLESWDKENA
ncbi:MULTISPECIES: histidine--tRNA ligase [Terrabacteria group]|uniref:histidine--tRNA ligase n=1 Tax=Bacillati TaxID=1783272 RepID=UPI001C6DE99F|nr:MULTISPECIES: histidine--tRNA ligase [Terrabacteria group]MBW9212304.1 histidine--tRNA ligase [Trueperella sp. zg.1013]